MNILLMLLAIAQCGPNGCITPGRTVIGPTAYAMPGGTANAMPGGTVTCPVPTVTCSVPTAPQVATPTNFGISLSYSYTGTGVGHFGWYVGPARVSYAPPPTYVTGPVYTVGTACGPYGGPYGVSGGGLSFGRASVPPPPPLYFGPIRHAIRH